MEGNGGGRRPRALELARKNARDAGVELTLKQADISRVDQDQLGGPYELMLDAGCLHGLAPEPRRQAIGRITRAAAPGAVLLVLAFAAARRGPLPAGIDPAEVPELFPQWELAFFRPATEVELSGPLRKRHPRWFQLTRR